MLGNLIEFFIAKMLISRSSRLGLIYRPLSSAAAAAKTAPDSTQPKPFEEIPSIPKGWPILGNFDVMLKPHGIARAAENLDILMEKHNPGEVGLLRANSKLMNPYGNGDIVFVMRPEDVQTVYRHEGKYPHRGDFFQAVKHWRDSRPGEESTVMQRILL